ncbi:unnamed protein product [Chilo suppressalis]|uniref:Insulin-like domain-containing protein n=2 Tax=Chilo suppressalis TaxID=168631 RepID=A0ABN8L401_CHISP|nr:unnamed protein product [Chilo suppressalis]
MDDLFIYQMLFAWLNFVLMAAVVSGASAASVEVPRIFCGRKLADARVLYCYGSDPNPTKRHALFPELLRDVQMLGEIGYKPWSIFNNALSPWPARQVSAKHTTNALTSLRPKRSPGLVDECCHKACYVSELMSYC